MRQKKFFLVVFLLAVIVFYQNCSPGFKLADPLDQSLSSEQNNNNSNNNDNSNNTDNQGDDVVGDVDDVGNVNPNEPAKLKEWEYDVVGDGDIFWVSKSGSDNNNCLTENTGECLTMQKAISLAGPGDKIYVKAGTYIEDSSKSKFTSHCAWMSNSATASLCMRVSGVKGNPITLRAAPGHAGRVTLDNLGVRLGIHLLSSDYIRIQGLIIRNSKIGGISSWGQVNFHIPDEDKLGVGIVIQRNQIYNTVGLVGVNTSAIAMWGSRDWVVRNNFIDGVSAPGTSMVAGIQSYGVINALIEHNEIINADMGVYWKDHHVKNLARDKVFESEIRYNKFNVRKYGVQIGVSGNGSPESGTNHIHHNIIHGFQLAGIVAEMSAAKGMSGEVRVEHNIFDAESIKGSAALSVSSVQPVIIKGNIITRTSVDIVSPRHGSSRFAKITYSDYNIFNSSFKVVLDQYYKDPSTKMRVDKVVSSLSAWQKLTVNFSDILGLSRPDTHSVTAASEDLFKDINNKEYKYSTGSKAIGFMSDGSNAGPYQKGNEVIGIEN